MKLSEIKPDSYFCVSNVYQAEQVYYRDIRGEIHLAHLGPDHVVAYEKVLSMELATIEHLALQPLAFKP